MQPVVNLVVFVVCILSRLGGVGESDSEEVRLACLCCGDGECGWVAVVKFGMCLWIGWANGLREVCVHLGACVGVGW